MISPVITAPAESSHGSLETAQATAAVRTVFSLATSGILVRRPKTSFN